MTARLVLADDEPLIRGGVKMLLTGHDDIEIVAEAGTGQEAVDQARRCRADLVLLDLRMPGDVDGVGAIRMLAEDRTDGSVTAVLALTMMNDDASVYDALRAGASGFLLKRSAPGHLLQAVRTVLAGENWVDPGILGQVIRGLRASPQPAMSTSELISRLTAREREILVLVAQGESNTAISERLVLSEATVRTHVSRILMKTGCRDRAQAVVVAYQSRLVRP